MGWNQRVTSDRELKVVYRQFSRPKWFIFLQSVLGALTWPLVLPLAGLSRLSDFVFRTVSEALSLVPYVLGILLRAEFYRWTLRSCGKNVTVGFGTVFFYRDVSIGDHVAIGSYNVIHHCDFGSFVLVADGCQFLSGRHYHWIDRTDVPIARQGGTLRRIAIGDDSWIGAGAIVMAEVGTGCVIGAGSVVTRAIQQFAIACGNPAKPIGKRG